jgi:hypothetical protein
MQLIVVAKGDVMKNIACMLWLLLGFGHWAFAAEPDFSGNWGMLRENGIIHGKSVGRETPIADSGILIAHTGNRLVVESQCVKCGNPIREYIIDGKERNMPNKQNLVTPYNAKWDGQALIINQGFDGPTPFGPATITSRQVWALSADKQVLTISTSISSPNGEISLMEIYKKQQ